LYNNYLNYLPIGSIIGFLFVFELFFLSWFVFSDMTSFYFADLYYELDWSNLLNYQSNIHLFGDVLYNNYFIFVFVLGLLLLVSMITAIVLVVSSDIKSKDFSVVNANNVSFFSFY
jgi:NADH:ubiquinone oxidoreductase subunit 6 (subunit J)